MKFSDFLTCYERNRLVKVNTKEGPMVMNSGIIRMETRTGGKKDR